MGELKLVLATVVLVVFLPILSFAQAETQDSPDLVILANSIDRDLSIDYTSEFPDFDIIYVDADSFDVFKGFENILILGGPDAPEGIGEVVQTILSEDEQAFLRKSKGTGGIFARANLWTGGQTITIIAGNNRHGTRYAQLEFLEELSETIESKIEGETVDSKTFELSLEEVDTIVNTNLESIEENKMESEDNETETPSDGDADETTEGRIVESPPQNELIEPTYPFTISFPYREYTVTQKVDQAIYDLVGKKDYTYVYLRTQEGTCGWCLTEPNKYGVEVLKVAVHDYYVAKIDLNQIDRIANFTQIHWIGEINPEDKTGQTLRNIIYSEEDKADLSVRYKAFLVDGSLDKIRIGISMHKPDTNITVDDNEVFGVGWRTNDLDEREKYYIYGSIGDCGRAIEGIGVDLDYADSRSIPDKYWGVANTTQIQKISELECVYDISVVQVLG